MHSKIWPALTLFLVLPACGGDDGGSGEATESGTDSSTSAGTGSGSATDSATTGSSQGTDSGGSGSASASAGTGSASATTGGCDPVPTFEKDIVPIFEKSCGTADGDCHWKGAYGAQVNQECRGWLTLENSPLGAEFYSGPDEGMSTGCPDKPLLDRLLDLDAWGCEKYDARRRYVVPCDPEASYLYNKLGGGPLCNMDKDGMNDVQSWPMPPPPDELDNAYEISADQAQMIYDWIAAGAPTDAQACADLCGGDTGGSTGSTGDTGGSTGGVGGVPEVQINHPGNGEQRPVNQNIPLVGVANDAEDGALSGNALVWSSSIEGDVAMGENTGWVPTQTGTHTLTLTATDSDSNEGSDSIQIEVVP